MWVPAHDGVRCVAEHLGPAVERAVDEDELLVVARGRVTEQDLAEPAHDLVAVVESLGF